MRVARRTEGVKVLVSGVPDVCRKGSRRIDARMMAKYRREIDDIGREGGDVIITTFYPPAYLGSNNYGMIDDINEKIVRVNRSRGEITPRLEELVFHPSRRGKELDRYKLTDGLHPNRRLTHDWEELLSGWKAKREEKIAAREHLERREKEKEKKKAAAKKDNALADLELQREAIDARIREEKIKLKYQKKRDQEIRRHKQALKKIDELEKEELGDRSRGVLGEDRNDGEEDMNDGEEDRNVGDEDKNDGEDMSVGEEDMNDGEEDNMNVGDEDWNDGEEDTVLDYEVPSMDAEELERKLK